MHNVSRDETVVYACLWWDTERENDLDAPWPLTLPSDNGSPRVAAADRRS
jgi:hypothetical protein